jgi:FixJ family two-component response regulator
VPENERILIGLRDTLIAEAFSRLLNLGAPGEVLEQVALGRSNDEIAERLFISRNTVRFHLCEIYVRLGVRNRVEAVRAGVTETA